MHGTNHSQNWLPSGKRAAVCFSIDDIHPGSSHDAYEAGGDLERGALGRVQRLLERQPQLRVTLFVTPNWRPLALKVRRGLKTRIPILRDHVYWTSQYPRNHMRLDRHPDFVAYLNGMPRTDVAMHGLRHIHPGPDFAVEFQQQTRDECFDILQQGLEIFADAGLSLVAGFQPPAWNLPDSLIDALGDVSIQFVSSARDLVTPVSCDARTNMSGLKGVSLIYPQAIGAEGLVHLTTNFQASSDFQRAFDIVDCGGVLVIKAHIFKSGGGHTMIDGLDENYLDYLDELFGTLTTRYGDSLWWTSLNEISAQMKQSC